ncbi:MAG: lipocalin family protein [Gammaproteobacteria bacterium]
MQLLRTSALAVSLGALLGGCASHSPMPGVEQVDLDRFMGDWYVIASIPTPFEKDIYNAVESYERIGPKTVQTSFTFRKGGFDGERKEMKPVGYVGDDGSNALWGMQFIWPIKADYRIVYLDPDYSKTIIGRQKRDFVWIMTREPAIPESDYEELVSVVKSLGYDVGKLVKVPQRWETKP